MTDTKPSTLQWLKDYWFLISFVVISAGAWAENTTKVQSLEDAVKANAYTQAKVEVLDERTKSIKEEQVHQRELLEKLLRNQEKTMRNQ